MGITLNLTAVLITAIICLTVCFICKSSKDEKEPDEKKDWKYGTISEVPRFTAKEGNKQDEKLDFFAREYKEERERKKGDIKP